MRVKKFNFPTFEGWKHEGRIVRLEMGAYYCEIDVDYKSTAREAYVFRVAFATRNPIGLRNSQIFSRKYISDGDENKLEKWYNNTIKEFNVFWSKYIKITYLEESENK